jgi:type IV pilus assembly protein PilV
MSQNGSKAFRVRNRRRGGMTLVEIMIAMVILSFGLLGVAGLQVRAITEGSAGRHLSDASAIARNRVEALTRQAWDAAILTDTGGAWTAPTNLLPAEQTFARSERITNNAVLPGAVTIKAVEVRVLWGDKKRQNRSVVLSSARLREFGE